MNTPVEGRQHRGFFDLGRRGLNWSCLEGALELLKVGVVALANDLVEASGVNENLRHFLVVQTGVLEHQLEVIHQRLHLVVLLEVELEENEQQQHIQL